MPGPVTSSAVDITSRSDVHDLVVGFYREIVFDDVLAPVFAEVAETDWTVHIPRLIDYWCRILLGETGYRGAILAAHRHVHDVDAFRVEHFDRWYELWARSIDATWQGPVAENAKRHAARVGASLTRRLLDTDWQPGEPSSSTPVERRRTGSMSPVVSPKPGARRRPDRHAAS